MENKIKVSTIKISQINKLAKVYVKAFGKEAWSLKQAEKLLNLYFNRQPDMFLIASINGDLVGGFCCLIKPWWDGNHLVETELFVDPKFHKTGIGRVLFKSLLARAQKNHKAVILEGITFAKTAFPLNWYKKIGIYPTKELVFIDGKVDLILKKLEC